MKVLSTALAEVVILEPTLFNDARGYFLESYLQRDFDMKVRPIHFIQDNESRSSYGVLRGLHFQIPPHAQSKLVRVIDGAVLDVAVDIRRGSDLRAICCRRTECPEPSSIVHPPGFAHGFSVLTDKAIVQYKCDNYYAPQSEGAIAWNDPDLNIDWRIPQGQEIISEKDRHRPLLSETKALFDYKENLYQE